MKKQLLVSGIVVCLLVLSVLVAQQPKSGSGKVSSAPKIPVFDKSTAGDPIITPNGEIIYELTGRGVPGTSDRHSIAFVILPPGNSTPNHYHPEDEESYYILKGKGHMNVG
ncbi:MAG: cupin domain-containing protein, partial [Verrucomicrobiae bacterium]|nr:cupin domain-containing protein [Verrucomicrobiae bacterium]